VASSLSLFLLRHDSCDVTSTVYIVDDDAAVREGLEQLFAAAGLDVHSFASADAFLAECQHKGCAGCVVLDVAMPGMSGTDLQAALAERAIRVPIIFLTGQGDVPTSVQAMKAGAMEFFEKPISGPILVAAVRNALARSDREHEDHAARIAARSCYAKLTGREREVMALAVAGLSNKAIAKHLALSHRTVEIHRARAMRKMRAASLLELAHAAELCGIAPSHVQHGGGAR
jgi:RNA polymerase sigma factor (sigma-70 family)